LKSQTATHNGTGSLSSELGLPAELSQLAVARKFATQAAAAFGLDGDGCYEFVYAVNEAVTNAIRHGLPDERGLIHVSVSDEADRLTCVVRDCGTFIPPPEGLAASSEPAAEQGRGLMLMQILMDEVQLRTAPGSTTVYLSKVRP
jgi:stage II sporulation protein AB (anti-sigma F factor)